MLETEITEWVYWWIMTCRLFGVSEYTTYTTAKLFTEGLKRDFSYFCPACDAGAGHCNGSHKGNDEIPF